MTILLAKALVLALPLATAFAVEEVDEYACAEKWGVGLESTYLYTAQGSSTREEWNSKKASFLAARQALLDRLNSLGYLVGAQAEGRLWGQNHRGPFHESTRELCILESLLFKPTLYRRVSPRDRLTALSTAYQKSGNELKSYSLDNSTELKLPPWLSLLGLPVKFWIGTPDTPRTEKVGVLTIFATLPQPIQKGSLDETDCRELAGADCDSCCEAVAGARAINCRNSCSNGLF